MRRIATLVVLAVALARPLGAQTVPLAISMSGDAFGQISVQTSEGLAFSCSWQPGQVVQLCNPELVQALPNGTIVTLSAATPRTDFVPGLLSGGSGPAAGCAYSFCRIVMAGAASVHVDFSAANGPSAALTVLLDGDGTGAVDAGNVSCQNVNPRLPQTVGCSAGLPYYYLRGSTIRVAASPGPASRFATYSTAASPACAAADCDVTLVDTTTLTATFHALAAIAVSPSFSERQAGGPAQTFTAIGTFTDGVTEAVAPGRGTWQTAPDLPAARAWHAAAAFGGQIYVAGGTHNADPVWGIQALTADVSAYNPAARVWTARAPMPTPRSYLAAATAGPYLYTIGGSDRDDESNPVATVERYDPVANTWTPVAPLTVPRLGLAAATIHGLVYAIGGWNTTGVVATLEAYDPAADSWTPRASMPAPRRGVAAGAIGGLLYVVGGFDTGDIPVNTLEAYDPVSDTWTTKAAPPPNVQWSSATVADGLLYAVGKRIDSPVVLTYTYDPALDRWTARTDREGANGYTFDMVMASVDDAVYTIGGRILEPGPVTKIRAIADVEMFVPSLRWTSSDPAVAPITQQGTATPVAPGTTSIRVTAGTVSCNSACATFTATAPFTDMALDEPAAGASVAAPITVAGWALFSTAPTGTGVDAVHVYAAPDTGAPVFLGAAIYGSARPDVGALYGSRFANAGFTLAAGASLAPGAYTIYAFARNTVTGTFDGVRTARILLTAPVSHPFIAVDAPGAGQVVTSAIEVGGWALDAGAPGTGIDGVKIYVQPQGQPAPGVFIGHGRVGLSRPDVAALYGSQFNSAGFHFTISGLSPGPATLWVIGHSTVTGSDSVSKAVPFTVSATGLMSIDVPTPESIISANSFSVGGWAIDRSVEGTPQAGTGIDSVVVYAYHNPGSGEPAVFLGVASYGAIERPDVAAFYGDRYKNSGYGFIVDRAAAGLGTGEYNIVPIAHNTITGQYNNLAIVRVVLQ